LAKRADAIDLNEKLHQLIGADGRRLIFGWVASTSLWTNPEVYRQIQVIHPDTRRLSGKEAFRSNVAGKFVWRNEPPANAFWKAYGVSLGGSSPRSYKRVHLCHIYENSAHHHEHYTNLANLVAVPAALDSFTEWEPVRDLLKWKSYSLYAYRGPAGQAPSKPAYVPTDWPGIKVLTEAQVTATVSRLQRIRFERPGHTPRRDAPDSGSRTNQPSSSKP
jgi:hypothetical protein